MLPEIQCGCHLGTKTNHRSYLASPSVYPRNHGLCTRTEERSPVLWENDIKHQTQGGDSDSKLLSPLGAQRTSALRHYPPHRGFLQDRLIIGLPGFNQWSRIFSILIYIFPLFATEQHFYRCYFSESGDFNFRVGHYFQSQIRSKCWSEKVCQHWPSIGNILRWLNIICYYCKGLNSRLVIMSFFRDDYRFYQWYTNWSIIGQVLRSNLEQDNIWANINWRFSLKCIS